MRKRLVVLQALAILFTVFQYGMRAPGQKEGGNSDRILSSIFYPYLMARVPHAGSVVNEWLATKNRIRICVHIHRRYRGMPLWRVLPQILIGMVCTYGNRMTRTVWCYCSDKVYLYQLMVKSVIFYTLREWSALVNEMLLIMAGDVESNPGPETRLELDDLGTLRRLLQPLSSYWIPIADQLGMSSQVAVIQSSPGNTGPQDCLRDLLFRWLSREQPSATLKALCQALRGNDEIIGGTNVATNLEETFQEIRNSSQHPGMNSSHTEQQCMLEHPEEKNRKVRCHYANFLRDKYRSGIPSFFNLQWPPPPTRKVFNLAMITQEQLQYGPNEELVKLLLRGDVSSAMRGKGTVKLKQISASLHPRGRYSHGRKIFLIEGAPGSGKSTMAWHMCQMWEKGELFEEFEILLFVQLRDPSIQSAWSLEDLFPDHLELKSEVVRAVQYCGGHNVLIVLDGWDEFPSGLDGRSIIAKLICDPSSLNMQFSALIVMSQPIATAALQRYATTRIKIVGFMQTEVEGYFAEAIGDPQIEKKLMDALKERPVIEACCYLPMNAAIIVHVFLASNYTLPTTLHGVFVSLIHCTIRRHLTKTGEGHKIANILSLDDLPEDFQKQLKNICLLAYYGVRENKVTFSSADLEEYCLPTELSTLSLIQGVESFANVVKSKSYNFLHLSVQELLAAFHISKLPPKEQVEIFNKLFEEPRLSAVFQFYSAFTKLQSEGLRDVVARIVQRKSKILLLSLFRCLYEARDASLCAFVFDQLNGKLDLCQVSISPVDCLSLGYFLNSVGLTASSELEVNLTECRLDGYGISMLVKELSMFSGSDDAPVVGARVEGHLHINLANNAIDDKGAKALCDALKVNHSLKTLNLWDNKFTEEGKANLQKAAEERKRYTDFVGLDLRVEVPADNVSGTGPSSTASGTTGVEDPSVPLSTNPLPSQTSEQLSQATARERRLIQQHIDEQGSLEMNSYKMLLCGLPRTGKTTTMLRLSNQLLCLDPDDSPRPSTGFEKPRTVELQSVMIPSGEGKVEWKYQDMEQQIQTLLSRILKSSSRKTSSDNTSSDSTPPPDTTSSSQSDDSNSLKAKAEGKQGLSHTLKSSSGKTPSPALTSSSTQSNTASSSGAEEHSKDVCSSKLSTEVKQVLADLTKLVKTQGWKRVREMLKAFEDISILHIVDCGGHPECHDILPLLLEGRALSLIFLNLTHDLDKTYPVVFQGKERRVSKEYESDFSVSEVLQRILCSISSLQFGADKERPVALLVGSYLDKAEEKAVLALDISVQRALKSFIEDDILFPANDQEKEKKYIVTLNHMSEDQGDIIELRRVILKVIDQRFKQKDGYKRKDTIKREDIFKRGNIPTAWLLLHFFLRTRYEKEPGWCTVEECVEVARACGIKPEDVPGENGILHCIHKHYGTLLYYPNIPGLCEKVICDPNIILHTFTQTFLFSYACIEGYCNTAEKMRSTGEIPNDIMKMICEENFADPIPTSEIVALLKDRYILYENIRTDRCTRNYFMPCLLQSDPNVVKEASNPTILSSLNPAPLLLVPVSTGYVPLGLFPALVVCLTQMFDTWRLKRLPKDPLQQECKDPLQQECKDPLQQECKDPPQQECEDPLQQERYRNRIQFKVKSVNHPTMVVEFRQHLSYLELRFLKTQDDMDLGVLTECRQQLYEALLQVSSKFPCMKVDGLQWGFYCPGGLQPGGQPHPAVCQPITCPPEKLPFDMDCSHDPCKGQDFELKYKHKIWFKGDIPVQAPAQQLSSVPSGQQPSMYQTPPMWQTPQMDSPNQLQHSPGGGKTPISTTQASSTDADKELSATTVTRKRPVPSQAEGQKFVKRSRKKCAIARKRPVHSQAEDQESVKRSRKKSTELTLDDLGVLKRLIQPVAAHWVALADQLGMTSLVATIRGTPENTVPPAFLRDLLNRWLTKGHPTLEELCQALREDDEIIGGSGVADKLEERFQGQRD